MPLIHVHIHPRKYGQVQSLGTQLVSWLAPPMTEQETRPWRRRRFTNSIAVFQATKYGIRVPSFLHLSHKCKHGPHSHRFISSESLIVNLTGERKERSIETFDLDQNAHIVVVVEEPWRSCGHRGTLRYCSRGLSTVSRLFVSPSEIPCCGHQVHHLYHHQRSLLLSFLLPRWRASRMFMEGDSLLPISVGASKPRCFQVTALVRKLQNRSRRCAAFFLHHFTLLPS